MPVIAIVDDNHSILASVSNALATEGYQTQSYSDGATAFQGIQANPPDLAIFDMRMPHMDGMELLRRLRKTSDMPVILLTSLSDEVDEMFGLKLGADDFIRKPFSQQVLVERVNAVFRRVWRKNCQAPAFATNRIIKRGKLTMDFERHTCAWGGKPIILTATELLVLQELVQHSGIAKSRDALTEAAHDNRARVHDRSVDSHIKRLRKKFKQVDDTFEAIETLYGAGYRFKEA